MKYSLSIYPSFTLHNNENDFLSLKLATDSIKHVYKFADMSIALTLMGKLNSCEKGSVKKKQ